MRKSILTILLCGIVVSGCRTPSAQRVDLHTVETQVTPNTDDSLYQNAATQKPSPIISTDRANGLSALVQRIGGTYTVLDDSKSVRLNLSNTAVSLGDLAKMIDDDRIADLDLSSTDLGDDAMALLAGMKNLKVLNFANTKCTDYGLRYLSKMEKLELIGLSGTAVSDKGMHQFTDCPELRYLMLDNTSVSDDGLQELSVLVALEGLSIVNTKVSPIGVKAYKAAIPHCVVVFKSTSTPLPMNPNLKGSETTQYQPSGPRDRSHSLPSEQANTSASSRPVDGLPIIIPQQEKQKVLFASGVREPTESEFVQQPAAKNHYSDPLDSTPHAWSHTGNRVAIYLDRERRIALMDQDDRRNAVTFEGEVYACSSICFCASGEKIAALVTNRYGHPQLQQWKLQDGRLDEILEFGEDVVSVEMIEAGLFMIIGDTGRREIWSVDSEQVVWSSEDHNSTTPDFDNPIQRVRYQRQ